MRILDYAPNIAGYILGSVLSFLIFRFIRRWPRYVVASELIAEELADSLGGVKQEGRYLFYLRKKGDLYSSAREAMFFWTEAAAKRAAAEFNLTRDKSPFEARTYGVGYRWGDVQVIKMVRP